MKNMKWDVVVREVERRTAEPIIVSIYVYYDFDKCVVYRWYAAGTAVIECREEEGKLTRIGSSIRVGESLFNEIVGRVRATLVDEITGRGLFTAIIEVNDKIYAALIEEAVEELKALYPPK
ncbi:MAG: hypothetical protein QW517_08590 [Thermofilaceae archaeon]